MSLGKAKLRLTIRAKELRYLKVFFTAVEIKSPFLIYGRKI